MELLIAFLMTLFSFHGDATYHQPSNHGGSTISSDFQGRPDPGKVDGPIIVIEDIHFRPPKTE